MIKRMIKSKFLDDKEDDNLFTFQRPHDNKNKKYLNDEERHEAKKKQNNNWAKKFRTEQNERFREYIREYMRKYRAKKKDNNINHSQN